MFNDALLLLSDAQAFAASGVSTNVIDFGNTTPKRRIGSGEPLAVLVSIDVAADFTTTDETYTLRVLSSAAANLSTPTVLAQRTLTGAAERAAGARFVLPIPPGTPLLEFVGLDTVLGGTTPSITITASLVPLKMAEESLLAYAKAYNV